MNKRIDYYQARSALLAAILTCVFAASIATGIGMSGRVFSEDSSAYATQPLATQKQSGSLTEKTDVEQDKSQKTDKDTKAEKTGTDDPSTKKDTSSSSSSDQSSTDNSAPSSSTGGGSGSAADGSTAAASGETAQPATSPPPPPPAPATITVSVYIDSSAAASYGWPACMASTSVTLAPGSSVYDALCATGVGVGGSNNYVSSINGLAEFSCGPSSGWIYYVNGSSPGYGCGSYTLYGGESISWSYTLEGWR
ncbi:MAG: DUF4430 domain-containing protein [Coriobacteriia bacterium]|nr:DUF4430 domain-containing protein [Coriobacteriia bacterium]